MPTLRLTQQAEAQPDHYRVEIALESAGPHQSATAHFRFPRRRVPALGVTPGSPWGPASR